MPRARLLLASTLTPTHPGAGRSPGLVDLPVVRDPLGYPYIPGSEVKGALKSLLARKLDCLDSKGEKIDCDKKVKRNGGVFDCGRLCCLLGAEEGGEGSSCISITSMTLFAIPAPSPDLGVIYITTPTLLSQAAAFMEAAGRNQEASALSQAASVSRSVVTSFQVSGSYVWVGASRVEAQGPDDRVKRAAEVLQGLAGGLNPLYTSLPIKERLVVAPEDVGRLLVEKSLLRLTRVRLDRATKTVSRGALWTEEYLPSATLLVGLAVETGFKSRYCDKPLGVNELKDTLKDSGLLDGESFYLTIGGKESVGSGLVKIVMK